METGNYENVDGTIVYKENNEIKTSQSEDIVRLKPTYNQVQTLIKEGKRQEAQTIVNKLSKEDYEAYKKVKSSEATKITNEFKDKLESDPKEAVKFLRSVSKEHQDRILKNMTDEEYEIYKSGK
jgi:Mg/Co/Ni transporter MgtE